MSRTRLVGVTDLRRRVRCLIPALIAGAGLAFLTTPVAAGQAVGGMNLVQAQAASVLPATSSPSVVARAKGTLVSVFTSPTSKQASSVLHSPSNLGIPLVFLVSDVTRWPTWVRVYLPNRPNQSQGWIRASAVALSSDPYLVRVQLGGHRLTVYNDAKVVLTTAVGVGPAVLPTPTGTYYLVELLKQPNPRGAYGPYAFGLSAYSDVLQSFGGGPGQIGLHGTDDPAAIGSNVSHGCVRVANTVITKLAGLLPLGTPVIITH